MTRRAPLARGERGSVSILAAGVLVVAAVLGLASVDVMRVLVAKARAQTAADAAALAAAQQIVIPRGEAPPDIARAYADLNESVLVECRCEPGTSEAIVRVLTSTPLVLLGGEREVGASARAIIEGSPAQAGE